MDPFTSEVALFKSLLFETFSAQAFNVAIQVAVSFYTTGIVILEGGDGVSHTVPIYEGHCFHGAVLRLSSTSRDSTAYLQKILSEQGYSFTTTEKGIVGDIKENLSCVALDYNYGEELQNTETLPKLEQNYELLDGQIITIGGERTIWIRTRWYAM